MKKILYGLLIAALTFGTISLPTIKVKAQSTKKVVSVDTLVDAETQNITFNPMSSKLRAIQVTVKKVTGTVAGKVYLEGTIDGNYVLLDSLTLSDQAINTKIFPFTRSVGTNYLGYRARFATTGTQTSTASASWLRRTDD